METSSDSVKVSEESGSQQFGRDDSSRWLAESEEDDHDFRWSDAGEEEVCFRYEGTVHPSAGAKKRKVKWRPPRLSFSAGKMSGPNMSAEMTKRIETKLRLVASATTAESQDSTDPWKARPANFGHMAESKLGIADNILTPGSSVPLSVSASECSASGDAGSSRKSATQPSHSNPEANSNQTPETEPTQEVRKSDHCQYEIEATNERLPWNPEPELPESANGFCCCLNAFCCVRRNRNEEKCSTCGKLVCVGAALLIILFWILVLTNYKET